MDKEKREKCIEIYRQTKNFNKAVKGSGLSVCAVQIILAKAGLLTLHDKVFYGTRAVRLGGEAEMLFQKLVPEAINLNDVVMANHPAYDFDYKGLRIDVKYSSRFKPNYYRNYSPYYKIKVGNRDKDLIVAFFERDFGMELEKPYIAILHQSMAYRGNITFTVGVDSFKEVLVKPSELKMILDEYVELMYERA